MEESEIYEALGLEAPEAEDTPPEPEEGPAEDREAEPPEGEQEGAGGEPGPQLPREPIQAPTPAPAPVPREMPRQEEGDGGYAAAFGRMNPYTGRTIDSQEEYDAYRRAFEAERGTLHPTGQPTRGDEAADIARRVAEHPAVQAAQRAVDELNAERARSWYEGQIKEIAALDPTVTSLQALSDKDPEKYGRMMGMVSGGVSLVDAYKALNLEDITKRQTAAAAQAERNRAAGKAHLSPVGGKGTEAVEVPPEVRSMYLEMNPDMTDGEIRKEYAQYLQDTR